MLIQLPKNARRLRLPQTTGKNKAWNYIKSIDGATWLRQQFSWLSSPFPRTIYTEPCQIITHKAARIGTIKNGKCLSYIIFSDAVFTVHYCSDWHRERHYGMAGPNAGKYRGVNPDELGLVIKRFDVRRDERDNLFLRKNNYEHFIDL